MKERIKEKLEERLELILSKDVKDITPEEFMVLSSKLSNIECEENKEERNKDMVELLAKTFKY